MSPLSTACTLEALRDAARALHLEAALAAPLAIMTTALSTSAGAALASARSVYGARTVGDLVTNARSLAFLRHNVPRRVREEIVAAVRAHLIAAAPATAPGKARTPAKAPDPVAAARFGEVSDCLDLPVKALDPFLEKEARRWLTRVRLNQTPIGALLADKRSQQLPPWLGPPPASLDVAIAHFVDHHAERRRGDLAEDRAFAANPPAAPADPAARRLHERALTAWRATRRHAPPRSVASVRVSWTLDPASLHFEEAHADWMPDGRRRKAQVSLPLSERDGALAAHCACAERTNACAHVVTAYRALINFLTDPAVAEGRDRFLREWAQPGWARALAAIDGALLPFARGSGLPLLAWRLTMTPQGHLDLAPALEGGPAGKRARKLPLDELLRAPAPCQLTDVDRAVIDLLQASRHGYSFSYQGSSGQDVRRALLRLVDHPRVYLWDRAALPLAVRRGSLALRVCPEQDGAVTLIPEIEGRALLLEDLLRSVRRQELPLLDLDVAAGTCRVVPIEAPTAALLEVLAAKRPRFPAEATTALLARLPALASAVALVVPAGLRGEELPPDLRPRLRLEVLPGEALCVDALVRPLSGGDAFRPGEGSVELYAERDGRRVSTRRDLDREPAATRAALAGLPLPPDREDPPFTWRLEGDLALALVAQLQEREAEFDVQWVRDERRRVRSAASADLRVAVSDRRDWFGLDGAVELDGLRVELAALLDALRAGRRLIAVKGGTWLRLSEDLHRQLVQVADVVFAGRQGLEVSPLAMPAIAELAAAAGHATLPPSATDLIARIRAAAAFEPPAPALAAPLRPYQEEGYRWLSRLAAWGVGGVLADDMGLGKTIEALALLTTRAAQGPALVVAPTSVGWNWVRETQRFAPALRVQPYREADRAAVLAALGPGDVLVVSYGLLVRDLEAFRARPFATLVLDEAQAVKNALTKRAQAVRAVDARFRVALTGTPVENHLGELWSVLSAVAPGLLGSWEQFRARFALPIERHGDAERKRALARLVRPFILRRTKGEVARDLPPKVEMRLDVPLSTAERRLYDAVRVAVLARLSAGAALPAEQRRFQVLAGLTKLRQLACHPRLHDDASAVPSSKLARLLEVVDELRAEGRRALVFSQFTRHLALVREALDARGIRYQYLDGATPEAERRVRVDAFQAGGGELFLISLKAGGTGLNLTAADFVLHLDPWWNPAVEDQATDRAHRIGQTRPVTVCRLVAAGTIEEQILSLHAGKRALVDGVLAGTDAAARLSTDELVRLLAEDGPSAEAVDDEPADGDVATPPTVDAAGGADTGAVHGDVLGRFEAYLENALATGALSEATAKAYLRSAARFAAFLTTQGQAVVPDEFDVLVKRYFEALRGGKHPAPPSELLVAKPALNRLGRCLAERS